MNAALYAVHVLTCLVLSVNFIFVHGQGSTCCENCCDNRCNAPTPFNLTLDELAAMSPIYANLIPAVPYYYGVDNICYTFVALPDGTYLLTSATVFVDGSNITQSYIDSEQSAGVVLLGSGNCVFQATVFDYVDSCSLYLSVLCFKYGECSVAPGNSIPVIGFSSNDAALSEDCVAIAIDRISRAGIADQKYLVAPFAQPTACVTNLCC